MQALDPSRLYNPASGWVDAPVGDLIDMHKYVGPGAFNPTSTRASVLGEFGGLGLKVDSHQWIPEDSFSYEMQVSAAGLIWLISLHHLSISRPFKSFRTSLPGELRLAPHTRSPGWHTF